MAFNNSTEFQDNYVPINKLTTTLTADIDDLVTIIAVTDVTGFPDMGWFSIDDEVFFYNEKTDGSNTFGSAQNPVVRGVNNTNNAAHSAGSYTTQRINAETFIELMGAIKKRKDTTVVAASVAADTISDQNLTGFYSRADMNELRIIAKGGSTDFTVELYRKDTFLGVDKIYSTTHLSTVESTLDQDSNAAQKSVYITSTTGFLIGELAALDDDNSSREFILIDDIVAGDSLVSPDNLVDSFTVTQNAQATLVYRDQAKFYYEDLDWTGELHARISNYDSANPVQIDFNIIAEVSD